VNWPENDPVGAQDALLNAYLQIENCEDQIEGAYLLCHGALLDGTEAQACERCTFPSGCSYDELRPVIDGLPSINHPDGDPNQPQYFEVSQTTSSSARYLRPYSTHACFMTGLRGKFVGGGEAVQLDVAERPNQGLWWLGTVSSQRTEPSEHISGEFHCVKRSLFEDDSGGGLMGGVGFDEVAEGGVEEWYESYRNAIYPLAGIRGALDGDDDYAQVVHRAIEGDVAFRIRAASDYIRADFQEYWLADPFGGTTVLHEGIDNTLGVAELRIQIEQVLNRTRSLRMIPAREGFCFLSRIRGYFDGRGERVRIVAEDGHWYLRGASYPDKDLEIWAQCVRYEQMGYF
jgi:hypothetical protein